MNWFIYLHSIHDENDGKLNIIIVKTSIIIEVFAADLESSPSLFKEKAIDIPINIPKKDAFITKSLKKT